MENKELLNTIHRFAEDREIDYTSAQHVGKAFGIEFDSEASLVEWKQTIDKYLKTFDKDDFASIEEMCKKKSKKKKSL